MRKLKFAYANACSAKYWRNKEIAFDDLCARLTTPIRTSETVEEYPKLSKPERDKVKDKGGYVPALLKGGRRKRETVEVCSMVKLDGDKVKVGFIEEYEMLNIYASFLHTTHSHTPEAPRVRIGIPLTRDVTPEELNAVTRYIADMWGIDQFDECSYRPHQLMYWPSVPSNGEYVFKKFDGEWLDPDKILAEHPNWRDVSTLPTSSRESRVIAHEIKRQADPLGKDGLIGAFNNTFFPVQTLLDTELSDIYEPVSGGRYSFIPADSTAGGVVYDDKFFYSNHASDPAYGRLCSAFDLVRVHRFGDMEDKDSVKAMLEYAQNNETVKAYIARQRREQAGSEFADVEGGGDKWEEKLKYQPKSKVLENSVWNLLLILNNDPDFRNFAYNEMSNRVQITGEVPWERPTSNKYWRDADTAQLKAIIDLRYVSFSSRNHDVCFAKVTDDRRFHPIRDYLDALPPWDGIPRIDTQLIRLMQADDTPYVWAVTRKTHVAAVARICRPGIKFDNMLVLDGNQGIGKSSYFKELVGEDYYCETLSLADMADKSGAEKVQDSWAAEVSELAGIKKTDVEVVKSFLSTSDDKYRPSYGKTVESHPRHCVLIGTVNGERGYLRDVTGNRRFWIVKVRQEEQSKNGRFLRGNATRFGLRRNTTTNRARRSILTTTSPSPRRKPRKRRWNRTSGKALSRSTLKSFFPQVGTIWTCSNAASFCATRPTTRSRTAL